MASAWSRLHLDLLGLIFAHLCPRDLLRAALVCQSWNATASADALWYAPLARVLKRSPEEVKEECGDLGGDFGALRLKDIFLLAPHRVLNDYDGASNKRPPFSLKWFVRCPFNPRRHSRLTLPNMVRLMRCWWSHGGALYSMAGQTLGIKGYEFCPTQCWKHRRVRYNKDFDLLATWTLRAVTLTMSLLPAGGIYLVYYNARWSCMCKYYSALIPLNVIVAFVPLGFLIAFLGNFTPFTLTKFNIIVNALFVVTSLYYARPYLLEYRVIRGGLVLLGGFVGVLASFYSPHLSLLQAFGAGTLLGGALAMWRVVVPLVLFLSSYFSCAVCSWYLAAAGFTPFRVVYDRD